MTSQFKLEGTVGPNNDVEPRDARKVKQALMRLGDLDSADVASLDFVDGPTLNGLKAFQKRKGLVADGIAKPGGPTEDVIADALAKQDNGASRPAGRNRDRAVESRGPGRNGVASADPVTRQRTRANRGENKQGLNDDAARETTRSPIPEPEREVGSEFARDFARIQQAWDDLQSLKGFPRKMRVANIARTVIDIGFEAKNGGSGNEERTAGELFKFLHNNLPEDDRKIFIVESARRNFASNMVNNFSNNAKFKRLPAELQWEIIDLLQKFGPVPAGAIPPKGFARPAGHFIDRNGKVLPDFDGERESKVRGSPEFRGADFDLR